MMCVQEFDVDDAQGARSPIRSIREESMQRANIG